MRRKVKEWSRSGNQWFLVLKKLVEEDNRAISPKEVGVASIRDPSTVLYDMALRGSSDSYERSNWMSYGRNYAAKSILIYEKRGRTPFYKIRDEYFEIIEEVLTR